MQSSSNLVLKAYLGICNIYLFPPSLTMTTISTLYPLSSPQFHNPSQYHAFINLFGHLVSKYKTNTCVYYQEGSSTLFHCLTYEQVDHISTNLACQWASSFLLAGHRDRRPIGFLADHSVDYFICFLALLKLRVPFLALSPRNSNMALANLLEKSNAGLLIASRMYELKAMDACNIVKSNHKTLHYQLISSLDLDTMKQEPLNPSAHTIINMHFTKEDDDMPVLIAHRFVE